MKYNPDIKGRRSIRLKGYDYSQSGMYFITICTQSRRCLFGEIFDGEMKCNAFGQIVKSQWHELSKRFVNIKFDEFIVMPNHIHGIVIVGAPLAGAHVKNRVATSTSRAAARAAPTLGDIIGAYKSLVFQYCLEHIKSNSPKRVLGKIWQRNYYEHIIRSEDSLEKIRNYIVTNPKNWDEDELNPLNTKVKDI